MAGPATNVLVMNNMEGSPLSLPVTFRLQPQGQMEIRMQLTMMQGMDGPHHFLFRASLVGEGGKAYPPLEIHARGTFG